MLDCSHSLHQTKLIWEQWRSLSTPDDTLSPQYKTGLAYTSHSVDDMQTEKNAKV